MRTEERTVAAAIEVRVWSSPAASLLLTRLWVAKRTHLVRVVVRLVAQ